MPPPATATGIFFNVNGKDVFEENVDPELTLAYYLRNKLGLRGTKLGCEEGICGSCTVVLGTWDEEYKKASYRAVNACLVPLFHVHRSFVITVEGVGSREKIHPIQDRMARGHALQCGFCSPGFVMSAYALLRNTANPTIEQINSAIRANLCRCTGYRPILEALYSFSDQAGGCCGGKKTGGGCCKDKQSEEDEEYEEKLLSFQDFPKYDPTQEIIFPPSLRTFTDSDEQLTLRGSRIELAVPKSLEQFKLARKNADNIISSGLITRLITARKPESFNKKWVTTRFVKEFNEVKITSSTVILGSALNIQTLSDNLYLFLHPNIGPSVSEFVAKFSSQQVANFATWSGAIVSAAQSSNFVSDLLLLLVVLDARLTLLSENGDIQQVGINEFLEKKLYSKCTIVNSMFERSDDRRLFCFKLGENSESDSTKFNFGTLIGNKCSRVFVGLGGEPKRLLDIETAFDNDKKVDVKLLVDKSGIKETRQLTVALNKLNEYLDDPRRKKKTVDTMNYLQYFKPSEKESVGRPIANYFNERAITGEAIFVNDIKTHEAVHLGFVLSTVPHAVIVNVDASEALKLEGVEGYFGIDDIPGANKPGLSLANMNFPDDTTVFADKKVESVGQVIGVIAASDVVLARRAAKLVRIEYKNLEKLVDFKDAREQKSYVGAVQHFGKPEEDVKLSIGKAEKILEGEAFIGGQEHFYMETQSSLVVPGEGDELVVHCSTQGTSFTQLMVAGAMNLPAHKVIVKTKRLGGGFGGKVNNASWIACMCAVVAKKLNRPVCGMLSREDDLAVTGKRHTTYAKYKVGIDAQGKVKGVHYEAWLNGGWSKDHTEGVTMVMGLKIDDVYNMGDVRFDGYPVKTNSCSNTALRGYGNPQVKLVNEGIMRRIAYETKKNVEEVKQLNFAVEGDRNYLGGRIHSDALVECWEYCTEWSAFDERRKQVEAFNQNSKTVKRGIAMSSIRFGLPHPGPTGHGIASLLINLDGSVQLSIGGTEMGQGLNQKMLQVCSEALKRPIDTINIVDSSTDKITNAPETGGSQNADTNGLAVLECCKKIMSRLKPIIDQNDGDWEKSIRDAFGAYVPLQCTEYGVVEREKFGVGQMESPYNTTGACAVEVEIDTLTGFNRVIRVDMVMDVGESLNPALDIGQIEGAFMQGYGLVTCEKITFNTETGCLDQNSASKYKIPKAENVPKDFRVKLLGINKVKGAQVYSSKGIGEPPLMMSCGAVHSALMNSIDSWRRENGIGTFVDTISPLSADIIVKLCSKD